MSRKSDSAISFGVGILFGVLGGLVAALLLAPKSGDETRKELLAVADSLVKEKKPNVIYIKKMNTTAIAKLQYTIETQFNKVIEAIKAGRMASAKKREELESAYKY